MGYRYQPRSQRDLAPPDPTSTTVTTQPSGKADFGQIVTFTATVADTSNSPDAETPIGTVQFTVDGTPFGTPVDLHGGTATITDETCRWVRTRSAPRIPQVTTTSRRAALWPRLRLSFKPTRPPPSSGPSPAARRTLARPRPSRRRSRTPASCPATPTGTVQFAVDGIPFGGIRHRS